MNGAEGSPKRRRPVRPCPICGKPSVEATWPFCSKRCADVDLGRWLGGRYAIPATREEDAAPPASGDGEPQDREGDGDGAPDDR